MTSEPLKYLNEQLGMFLKVKQQKLSFDFKQKLFYII